MTKPVLPKPLAAIAGNASPSREYYNWFRRIQSALDDGTITADGLAESIRQIVIALGAESGDPADLSIDFGSALDALVVGTQSIENAGTLRDGRVALFLRGDTDSPASSAYYGTDADGQRGYHNLPKSIFPVVTGEAPPVLVYFDNGTLMYTEV